MTRFQKILLAALAGMLVVFGALLAVFRARPGVLFEESLLKIEEQEGRTVYSGRAHGEPVTIAVTWPTNFETDVEFTIGDRFHDVCQVVYPWEPVAVEMMDGALVDGILVRKNGETLFEGGYDKENGYWFDKDGNLGPMFSIGFSGDDPWQSFEVTEFMAARFAFGPETSARGDPQLFAVAVLISVLAAVRVIFWESFFRFEHRWARDPEPSEGYVVLEQIVWVVIAVVAAGFYIASMTAIY